MYEHVVQTLSAEELLSGWDKTFNATFASCGVSEPKVDYQDMRDIITASTLVVPKTLSLP